MSLESMTSRSRLCSRNGFPISSSTVTSALTSSRNAACTPGCWSWQWCPVSLWCCFMACCSNCSDPGNFWPCYPASECSWIANPIAHQNLSPLHCSAHGTGQVPWNLLLVLCTTKFLDLNSARTSGCFLARVVTDVYRKPSGVVCDLGRTSRAWSASRIPSQVTFTKWPDVPQQEKLQWQGLKPVVKVDTGLCSLYPQKADYQVVWHQYHQMCSLHCKLVGGVYKGLQLWPGLHGGSWLACMKEFAVLELAMSACTRAVVQPLSSSQSPSNLNVAILMCRPPNMITKWWDDSLVHVSCLDFAEPCILIFSGSCSSQEVWRSLTLTSLGNNLPQDDDLIGWFCWRLVVGLQCAASVSGCVTMTSVV